MADQPFPDPIPGVIPFGTVTLFAGAPASGKTTILAAWCTAWRDAAPICGHPTNSPTELLYITADRGWDTNARIFAKLGFPDIRSYALVDDHHASLVDLRKPFQAHDTFQKLLDQLAPLPGAHVLVDPGTLFITGDSNKMRDVAVSFIGFSRRCHELKINLTFTFHMGKQKADANQRYARPQDRIAGSTAFAGFSHTQVYILDPEPPKQPYHILGWNPRDAAPEEFKITRDPETGLFVPYTETHEADAVSEQVLSLFPAPPTEISMEALVMDCKITHDVSRRTVYRALQSLISARRVIRMGRGHYRRVQPS